MRYPHAPSRTDSRPAVVSRATFLKTLGLGAAAAVSGLSPTIRAERSPGVSRDEVSVHPTGTFPIDVDEVSAAINGGTGPSGRSYAGGGTIRLKATNQYGIPTYFDFGDGEFPEHRATIEITTDVVILGERTPPGAIELPADPDAGPDPDPDFVPDRTVIYGGKRPFRCSPTNPRPTTLTVSGIFFCRPSLAAIQVRKTSGLDVSDCVVWNVAWDDTGQGFRVAMGIEATGLGGSPADLVGPFRLVNNRIRRADPIASPANFFRADCGIALQLARMDAQIAANIVSGFAWFGIGIDRNHGPAAVSANRVRRCGYSTNPGAGGIGVRGTSLPVVIERNDVECGECGAGLSSRHGISVASPDAIVGSNVVAGTVTTDGILLMTFTPTGTTIPYSASNTAVLGNRLEGLTAGHAQVVIAQQCNSNRLTSNDYGGIAGSGEAGIVVQGNDNRIVNEQFWGAYPGTSEPSPRPCVRLMPGSSGNAVSALKYLAAPQGFDLCDQVLDEGTNTVTGRERCGRRA